MQTCDILGAVATYAALINHTPLRGEQQATIYYGRRRCEKDIVKGKRNRGRIQSDKENYNKQHKKY